MRSVEVRRARRITVGIATLIACSDSTGTGNLELTSAQAQAIVERAGQIAIARPELSWLADSLELVIHSGAAVKQLTIRIDGTDQTYHAVGLNRAIVASGPTPGSFATFHMLAFDDPANPLKFIVVVGSSRVPRLHPR